MAYNGTIDVISGIRPKNNGTFPLCEAKDVFVADGKRLDVAIEEFESMNSQQNQQIAGLQENTSATGGLLDLVNARVTAIEKTKVVKTVNGTEPDENGNVAVEGGSDITVDDTLTIEGAAADAKAVSDALSTLLQNVSASYGDLRSALTTLDESAVKTVNGVAPDDTGNVVVEGGGSGGVSSWIDLTDKPFYETGEWVTIVENGTVTDGVAVIPVTDEQYTMFNKPGAVAKVTINGKEYGVSGVNVVVGGQLLVVFGDISVQMEFPSVRETMFIMTFIDDEGSKGLMFQPFGEVQTYSISFFNGEVKKLAGFYLDAAEVQAIATAPLFMITEMFGAEIQALSDSMVKTVNGVAPDSSGNVVVEVGSGGVSSWNDLSDKPFYDNSKTNTYFVNSSLLSALTEFLGVEGYAAKEYFNEVVYNHLAKEDVQATIVVDGTTYNCTSKHLVSDGVSSIAYGNTDALLGTGDTGEPFVMIPGWNVQGEETTLYWLLIAFLQDTAATEHTVSLSAVVEDIKTLDAKFHDDAHIRTIVEEVISEALEGDY